MIQTTLLGIGLRGIKPQRMLHTKVESGFIELELRVRNWITLGANSRA